MFDVIFLAQTEQAPQGLQGVETETNAIVESSSGSDPENQSVSDPTVGSPWPMFILMGGLAFLYFFMTRASQKKEKARKEMLKEVKKNDRVRTIGGIFGTVVEVREKEVVVKIDESNNTRIRIVREAISEIVSE